MFYETGKSGADFQFISICKNLPKGCNIEGVGESNSVVQRFQKTAIEKKVSRDYGSI